MNKITDESLDQQRWLMSNGLFTESAKDSIFMYGTLVHKDVKAVQVDVKIEMKTIHYDVYVPTSLIKEINLFNELQGTRSLIKLWRLKRLLKRNGSLNFTAILDRFVKDFCGPSWKATMTLWDYKEYSDEPGDGKD